MNTTRPVTAEEVPIDPQEFSDRLTADVDVFVEKHDLGAPRFDERLSDAEMREGLYTRVFNEIMALDVPREMLDEAHRFDNPQIFIHLLKQIEDEANHLQMGCEIE